MENKKVIQTDVMIVGAGPAGLTAALYASRANLKTVIFEQGLPGGEINNTADVENYPGYGIISGPELAQSIYQGAMRFGAEFVNRQVIDIQVHEGIKSVATSDTIYQGKVLILAMGSHHRKLQVPGEDVFSGKGVSYCAVCDGFFFKNKKILVVGGGDSAVEEGIHLTQFAESVTILHRRDQLRAQKVLQDRAFSNEKINFIWDSQVEEIIGDEMVQQVQIKNNKTGEENLLDYQGVFIYIGLIPNSDLVKSLNICDDEGWILTNERMETTIPGVFAVGDVRSTPLRQIATAVGDGSHAGHMAYQYIQSLG